MTAAADIPSNQDDRSDGDSRSPKLDETQSFAEAKLTDSSPVAKVRRQFPAIEGYKISGVLGQGGMAIVYRAVQTKLNRTVALKVLPAILSTASPSAVSRFRREAAAAARLHHTNIIPIYDFGESPDGYYYAMELILGKPLDVVVHHFAEQNASSASPVRLAELLATLDCSLSAGTETPDESSGAASGSSHSGRGRAYYRHVTQWMVDAADALHYAHGQGIIHRDIKPSNIILSVDGRIMIADFGLAKTTGDKSVTMTGSFLGTLRYVSPEQAMAKRVAVDHRTDVYSLGATMYELLCFQPAFPGSEDKEILGAIIARDPTPPRKINPTVPPELDTICLKCMEKSPDARYRTARALTDDLRRYAHDLPIVARRPGPVRRMAKFIRRHRAPVIAVTAAVLLLATTTFLARERSAHREQRVIALRESAVAYKFTKQWSMAEADLNKALDIDPNDINTLLTFGWLKLEHFKAMPQEAGKRALQEAEELCRRALQIDPNNIKALGYQGVALRRLKRYPEAIAALEKALDIQPRDYASWSNLGTTYAEAGDLEKAAERLRRGAEIAGVEKDEWHAAAWRNLAVLELHLRSDDAVTHVANALACYELDVLSWVVRARIGMELPGHLDVKEALDDAKHADKLANERNAKVKRIRALAHLRNGEFENAIKHARLAIKLDDMPAVNHLIMALAEVGRKNPIGARDRLAEAEETWPGALRSPGAFRATAGTGELWIESADQLIRLREEAETRLPPPSP